MSIIPGLGLIKDAVLLAVIGIIVLLVINPTEGLQLIIDLIVNFFDIGYRTIAEAVL